MTLFEQISKDYITARKENDAVRKNILTMLITDAKNLIVGTNRNNIITDDQMIKIIKNWSKKTKENIDLLPKDSPKLKIADEELSILSSYLPRQWDEKETKEHIENIIKETGKKDIGTLMKELKSKYDGLFDSKLAADIVKNLK